MSEGTSTVSETPEALFLAWLMGQPQGADIAAAAKVEIARLGRIELGAETRARLIGLLSQAKVTPPGASRRGRRLRH